MSCPYNDKAYSNDTQLIRLLRLYDLFYPVHIRSLVLQNFFFFLIWGFALLETRAPLYIGYTFSLQMKLHTGQAYI